MSNPTIIIVGSDEQARTELAEFVRASLFAAGVQATIDALKSPVGVSGCQDSPIRIKTANSVYFPAKGASPDEMVT